MSRMSRLTRDGTAETVSRDQILRRVQGQGKKHVFPVQLTTSRIGNLTRLIHTTVVVVFFTLTDRASTIPSNIRGCQSGTWSQRGTKVNGSNHGDNPVVPVLKTHIV